MFIFFHVPLSSLITVNVLLYKEPHTVKATDLLTGNSEAGQTLLRPRRVHVKDAGIAAFVAEAHPADDDSRGVLGGGGELHMLLSTHAVPVARLVSQQSLVLDIQPAHLPQGFTAVP